MAACIICLETSPPPIQSGCACRGDVGLAHIECLVQVAVSQQALRGNQVWRKCQTCKQAFTGSMQNGLAEEWHSRVADYEVASEERLSAESNLALSLLSQGKYADAERIQRKVLGAMKRVHGAQHPEMLMAAGNLASCLTHQGKYADAEHIEREALGATKRVLGTEHPSTLTRANNLAVCLGLQGKFAEAEAISREVFGARKRVLGVDHADTLRSANQFAASLSEQGKLAEGEGIQREVLDSRKRVLGTDHPSTLMAVNNLAITLAYQGREPEAEAMLQANLASFRRVLGPAHPETLDAAGSLESVRATIRSKTARTLSKTPVASVAAAGAARPLPEGTRVIVQRLVAKPEHNGKQARVLSFDVRTGRYVVALEDGEKLSLKAECVARAGCAFAGCASDEASSVCGRCQAVRYCSRECQRTDWKAHKPVCAAAHVTPS